MKIEEYYYRVRLTDGTYEEMVSFTAQNDEDLRKELNDPRNIFIKVRGSVNLTINKMHIVKIESHHVKYAK